MQHWLGACSAAACASVWRCVEEEGGELLWKMLQLGKRSTVIESPVCSGAADWNPAQAAGAAARVPLDAALNYTVTLQPGWSIITNPFTVEVPWSTVQNANSFNQSLWRYRGGYSEASAMGPYEGYFVMNDGDAPLELTIPYPASASTAASMVASAEPASRQAFRIEGKNPETTTSAEIWIAAEATPGRDRFDTYAPPAPPTALTMTLYNDAVLATYPWLNREAKPLQNQEGATFDLRLAGPRGEAVTLTASGLDALGDYAAYLFDPEAVRFYDLRTEPAQVRLLASSSASVGTRSLQVLVGTAAFIDEQRAAQLPDAFVLEPNYPNPFRSETTIAYTVPQDVHAGDVEVSVYNVLGQVVQHLVQAEKAPGRYFLQWNGRDDSGRPLASGVYFVRFIANDRVIDSHQAVLVR